MRLPALFIASLPALTCASFAFKVITVNGKPTRWNDKVVTFVFDNRGSDNFKDGCDSAGVCTSEKEAVRRAFRTWQSVEGTNIRFEERPERTFKSTGYDKENTIIWIERGWRQQSFSPPSAALAVTISTYKTATGEIVDADIHFNGQDFQWATIDTSAEGGTRYVDVENIAAHEIGHFFGLDHSSEDIYEQDPELLLATMFFASGPGDISRRALKTDDIRAIQYLYPEEEVAYPIVDSSSPSLWDAREDPIAVLEITGANFNGSTSALLSAEGTDDISGQILENTGSFMRVSFNVQNAPAAQYDLVIANSVDTPERLPRALEIISTGVNGSGLGTGDNVSQKSSASANSGCTTQAQTGGAQLLMLCALALSLGLCRIRRHSASAKRL